MREETDTVNQENVRKAQEMTLQPNPEDLRLAIMNLIWRHGPGDMDLREAESLRTRIQDLFREERH